MWFNQFIAEPKATSSDYGVFPEMIQHTDVLYTGCYCV